MPAIRLLGAGSTRIAEIFRRLSAISLLAAGLAGCATFAHPATGGAPADSRLVGTWRVEARGDEPGGTIAIVAKRDELEAVAHETGKPDNETDTYRVVTAEIGGTDYANIYIPSHGKVDSGFNWLIVRYAMRQDAITLWRLDENALAAAIRDGRLKGRVEGSGATIQPKIASESDEIAMFLGSLEGQAAAKTGPDDTVTLTRVAP